MWRPPRAFPRNTDPEHPANPQFYADSDPPIRAAPSGLTKPTGIKSPIVHTDPPTGAIATKLKNVFDFILQETAKKLEKVNVAMGSDGTYEQYLTARSDFNDFLDAINKQDPDNPDLGPAFNWVAIEPVMSVEGPDKDFIVGARVIAKWLGGTHSSSSGVAIKHP